jgi:predicted transcriptional regulator
MSVAEIIKELPKLSPKERSTVRRHLQELEEKDEVLFLHESADQMFQATDKEEAKNARRKAR